MEKTEKAVFANMTMVEDKEGRVLVQNKLSKSWGGYVFPGGHVVRGEFFTDAAVREVREECGLAIKNPRLLGIKQFITEDYRYVVTLFRADDYEGELKSSEEGEVFWMTKEELLKSEDKMPRTFRNMLEIFFYERWQEHCMMEDKESDSGWNESFR